jgi:hypothetical protein
MFPGLPRLFVRPSAAPVLDGFGDGAADALVGVSGGVRGKLLFVVIAKTPVVMKCDGLCLFSPQAGDKIWQEDFAH